MWLLAIPVGLLAFAIWNQTRKPNLANGAANKTNKVTQMFAPAFAGVIATLPANEVVTVLNNTLFASQDGQQMFVTVRRANNQFGLVNTTDLSPA